MNKKLIRKQDNVVCICILAIGGAKFVLAGNFRQAFPAISGENKLSALQVCVLGHCMTEVTFRKSFYKYQQQCKLLVIFLLVNSQKIP
jgi:hypothetical protein